MHGLHPGDRDRPPLLYQLRRQHLRRGQLTRPCGVPVQHRQYAVHGEVTGHSVPGLLDGHVAWAGELPAPQVLPDDLIQEGHAIPVARVQAMHEGKRRKRARGDQ